MLKHPTQLFSTLKNGNVSITDKVQTKKLSISASDVLDLIYDGKADHKIGILETKSRRMNRVNDFLKGANVFASMEICDRLGLVVSHETIIMSNVRRNCSIEVSAKSIDVVGNVSSEKSISLEASDHLNVNQGSTITAGEICLVLKSTTENLDIVAANLRADAISLKAEKTLKFCPVMMETWDDVYQPTIEGKFSVNANKTAKFTAANLLGNFTILESKELKYHL
uniref:Uncharacterized protein n=1 Tax=Panagrolaimus superbus TaxID=310955 RepID=A0A914YK89_9BILA